MSYFAMYKIKQTNKKETNTTPTAVQHSVQYSKLKTKSRSEVITENNS